jgi:hypothetical protein
MAITSTTGGSARNAGGTGNRPNTRLTPETYTTLGTLIDPTKPDNRDILVKAYGDQGLTGFIELTGAKKSTATADEVSWWEEGRLHKTFSYTQLTAASPGVLSGTDLDDALRLNDVLLLHDGQRVVVTELTGATTIKVKSLSSTNTTEIGSGTTRTGAVIGNIYAQGTNQPSRFYQNTVKKYSNPLFITKEVFIVNGSQATNIGWVNVDGSYLWYHKNEMDARKRFMNQREMMMVFGQAQFATNSDTTGTAIALETGSVAGTEGYFQAVERRGIVADVSGGAQGTFASITDMDQIILELDKEGAPMEYAMYVDRRTSLDIDDMLASGIATQVTAGLPGQFGAFNNDANMAIQLGFKSFTRGGYTFHKHDWKMLNDATIAGLNSTGSTYKGALIPLATVADAKTGEKAPALEMNYKAAGNYNRDVEHFVTGSILGYATDGEDVARFNYRSECNLVTRAANQHVVIK